MEGSNPRLADPRRLEPQASRSQAAPLLTRVSLALDRAETEEGAAQVTDVKAAVLPLTKARRMPMAHAHAHAHTHAHAHATCTVHACVRVAPPLWVAPSLWVALSLSWVER